MWWVATPALLPVVALAALAVVRAHAPVRARGHVPRRVALVVLLPRLVASGAAPLDALADGAAVLPAGLRGRVHAHRAAHAASAAVAAAVRGGAGRALHGRPVQPAVSCTPHPSSRSSSATCWPSPWVSARAVHLRVRAQRMVTPGIREVAFASDAAVRFRPGQWIELHVPHAGADARGSRRVFSLATPPGHADGVAVAFRVTETLSSFKQALSALPEGGLVRATGVGGDFVLPEEPGRPALLLAGGHRHHAVREPAGGPRPVRCRQRDVVVVLLLGPGGRGPVRRRARSTRGARGRGEPGAAAPRCRSRGSSPPARPSTRPILRRRPCPTLAPPRRVRLRGTRHGGPLAPGPAPRRRPTRPHGRVHRLLRDGDPAGAAAGRVVDPRRASDRGDHERDVVAAEAERVADREHAPSPSARGLSRDEASGISGLGRRG